MSTTHRESVTFRLIHMPCCGHLFCSINPRLPNFCPECGATSFARIKLKPESVLIEDREAWLQYRSVDRSHVRTFDIAQESQLPPLAPQ
jgi:predicted  nucleic acid-binding Zn-ribbon protein